MIIVHDYTFIVYAVKSGPERAEAIIKFREKTTIQQQDPAVPRRRHWSKDLRAVQRVPSDPPRVRQPHQPPPDRRERPGIRQTEGGNRRLHHRLQLGPPRQDLHPPPKLLQRTQITLPVRSAARVRRLRGSHCQNGHLPEGQGS